MVVKDGGGADFEPIPAGMFKAICVNVFDVGVQPGFQNGPAQHKIVILWEIEPLNKAGAHFTVSKKYTASIGQKANLRKDLESWRGKAFDADELKGFELDSIKYKPCQLNLVQSEKWTDINAVLPAAKSDYWSPTTPKDYIPKYVQTLIDNQLVQSPPKAPEKPAEDIF